MTSSRDTRVFVTLDGMRGAAAIGVVIFHWGILNHAEVFRSAYLAVDFFFLLSGFVLAKAYDGRLAAGLRAAEFMRLRLIRLYPLAFAAGAIAVSMRVALRAHGEVVDSAATFAVRSVSHFLLVPVRVGPQPSVFEWNIPLWSLFVELVANLVFAVAWPRTRGALRAIIAVSGAVLVAAIVHDGTASLGSIWQSFGGGIVRVMFSFFAGVAIYRRQWTLALPSALAFVAPAILVGVLAITPGLPIQTIRDVFCVLVLFPLLLVGAANVEPARWARHAFRFLGVTSYGVYVLHFPLLMLVYTAAQAFRIRGAVALSVIELCALAVLIPAVWALDRWYDAPVRRWLTDMLRPPVGVPGAAAGSTL